MGVLKNKTALVTGASRGIGRAIAERLARDGAVTAVHYGQNAKAAGEVVEAITQAGGRAFSVQADVRKVADGAALFEAADAGFRERGVTGLDILVNNAGVASFESFSEATEASFDDLFDTNVKGLFFVTQHALGRLRDGGRIINLSSLVARAHFPAIPAYAATKGAVDTLTRHLAAELGARAITVNAVAPGAIDTDMSAWLRSEDGRATAFSIQALQRVGNPGDIASVVAFLAGPDSGWITGQKIEASGGSKL